MGQRSEWERCSCVTWEKQQEDRRQSVCATSMSMAHDRAQRQMVLTLLLSVFFLIWQSEASHFRLSPMAISGAILPGWGMLCAQILPLVHHPMWEVEKSSTSARAVITQYGRLPH